MEIAELEKDFNVFYISATSFPEGVLVAHQKLHSLIPFSTDRNYFGISRPENGTIFYKAATEEMYAGEAEEFGCDTLILKKGKYIFTSVEGFRKNPEKIGTAFQQLLSHPGLDPQGYCVEWYLNDNDTVKCMIRLNN